MLFELVQNGHDARAASADEVPGEIAGWLLVTADDCGELLVANRGRAFTRSNLAAIINIGTSDKRMGEGIGNKGLGFRSVEALTDDVRIFSARPGASSGWYGAVRVSLAASLWTKIRVSTTYKKSVKSAIDVSKHALANSPTRR